MTRAKMSQMRLIFPKHFVRGARKTELVANATFADRLAELVVGFVALATWPALDEGAAESFDNLCRKYD